MKIAVPTSDKKMDPHFGHCQFFTFIEIDEDSKKILKSEEIPAPPHEPGVLPVWLAERGATVVIAGGMGGRAIALLEERGIRVLLGAPAEPPEMLVEAYLAGRLEGGQNSCDH